MQLIMQIINYFVGSTMIIAAITVIVSSIIMRLYLIRKIERRLGKKLKFISAISQYDFIFGPAAEIIAYIIMKYLANKFFNKNISSVKWLHFEQYALENAGYKIEEAPKSEIFLPFLFAISGTWFFLGGALLYFKLV